MLRCLTPWTHRYGWPRHGVETCVDCGKSRPARVEFVVSERFNVPRHEPRKPTEKARRRRKVVPLKRKAGNV